MTRLVVCWFLASSCIFAACTTASTKVGFELARVSACTAAAARFEADYRDGRTTYEEAVARIEATRTVCDELHVRLLEAGE
jgi:hypothetical protein